MNNQDDWLALQLKALDDPIADNGFTEKVMARLDAQHHTSKPVLESKNTVFHAETGMIIVALFVGITTTLLNFPLVTLSTWLAEQNTQFLLLSKTLSSSFGLLLIAGWIVTAASFGWSLLQLR